ncbi:MAG: chemotaxis protein CheW [Myxococcota bacterium]
METPEDRAATGKDPEGTLVLRAYHEGGQVTIEVSDDGRGIAAERVKEKAVAQGAISAEEAEKLSPREALNLIFIPALSTADKVSSISGRGVGMDVVRSNIEKIGGAVEITSTPGKGTTCRIRIPLTLAIVPALIVTCGAERFAIPQVSLLELVRVDDSHKDVDEIEGVMFYRLRGRLLPLVSLKDTLEIEGPGVDLARSRVVVLQSNNQSFGLIVDEVHDTEEIVVKPLGAKLRGLDAFAGATIMGDGSVALILDAPGLAQRAGVSSRHPHAEARTDSEDIGDHNAVLHFEADGGLAMSVALGQVARLEEINPKVIERVRNGLVVQYRDSVLRLMELSGGAPNEIRDLTRFDAVEEPIPVLVCDTDTGPIGLVVEKIVDITLAHQFSGDAQTGLIRVDGNVVELIDLGATLGLRSAA